MTYTELLRKDLGVNRAEFSRRYNIPVRTLENWESGKNEAPAYVVDLLAKAVHLDITGKKPVYYVVAIGHTNEWDCGKFESYLQAVSTARDEWEKRNPGHVLDVEIRIYEDDIEDENCDNLDYWIVEYNKRKWYAVQKDREDDWGDGSFDRKEAIKMLKEQGYGLIAVIDGDVCIEEIEFDDIAD